MSSSDHSVEPHEMASLATNFPALARTFDKAFSLPDLLAKLSSDRPLRIKWGVDVTAPFLHLGHAVNLWNLRELQDHGHRVIFLIGDFTTRIGDPTGKSKTRPVISPEQITRDAEEYVTQVSSVVRTDPEVFEVRRNSEWWDGMGVGAFLKLLTLTTHAKLIQRDMFQRRIAEHQEIYTHELIYPILQAYDSVQLESDLTIIGTDQLFNELMGRHYQERLGQAPQTVVTTKITPGIDGKEKQSKSLNNYIGLKDSARDKFGKVMSLPDHLVEEYFRVYTMTPLSTVADMARAVTARALHPMDAKRALARAIVERYHSEGQAASEDRWFTETFSQRSVPADIPQVRVKARGLSALDVLAQCMPDESRSNLRRLMQQGAIRGNDDNKITDPDRLNAFHNGDIVRAGKRRWFRIMLDD